MAHIMGRKAKHEGALAHISLQRSVEMLALQCAQRFPARPADPDSSVFAELFPAPQPEPSQPNVPTAKARQMHLNWSPLGFMSDLSTNKFVQPSVGSRDSSPPLSTVTLPQLRMLFQSTHEDRQGAEALAEPGERIAKSPLQRTLTAHIMSRWAKHEGALAHINLKRSIEMLELQCAQRFPARPADPGSSVFAELFPAPQPEPSQPNVPTDKAK